MKRITCLGVLTMLCLSGCAGQVNETISTSDAPLNPQFQALAQAEAAGLLESHSQEPEEKKASPVTAGNTAAVHVEGDIGQPLAEAEETPSEVKPAATEADTGPPADVGEAGPSGAEVQTEPFKLEGQTEPSGPEGQMEPSGPEGQMEPSGPEGQTEPSEPEGQTEPSEPEGQTEPSEPESQTEPSEPEGQTEPSEPEGQVEPFEPQVQPKPVTAEGTEEPADGSASVQPSAPEGKADDISEEEALGSVKEPLDMARYTIEMTDIQLEVSPPDSSEVHRFYVFAVKDDAGEAVGQIAVDRETGEKYTYQGEGIIEDYSMFPLYEPPHGDYDWEGEYESPSGLTLAITGREDSGFTYAFSDGTEGYANITGDTAKSEDGEINFLLSEKIITVAGGGLTGNYDVAT